MPTKNNDDDGETSNEVLHNTCIQYFIFACHWLCKLESIMLNESEFEHKIM